MVKKGDLLAGTKVIPLVVPESIVARAEQIAREAGWVLKVLPFKHQRVGVIITGSEVYRGRISDSFGTVLRDKVGLYGSTLLGIEYAPDNAAVIAEKIRILIGQEARLILVTGGMSVDPDDVTPSGIKLSGAVVEKYGAPVFPGAMFLLAYLDDIPVLGVPACGMYYKTTILDLILPRLLIGERVTSKDIVALANGGLCRGCADCSFPNCTFGRGANLSE
jgi:molybdopterin biosynthesis enzyme